ncbi:ATP-binding protein [Hyphomonas sp. UBA4494]|jgi:hypothetical protein|uniref:ATP-binding protein n=1 Tax=Hyphomonas sp. UBA4494 TaxID=1946631 RepID=UPI0025C72015|nr:ATP-binding protein [Hyphomonas sp. UBA4494]
MSILVGEVIGVHGTKVTIRTFDNSNKETLFYEGRKHKGVSVREHICIRRGFRDIVCVIEGEYLDERIFEGDGENRLFIRKVEAKPIGYLENQKFNRGIKFLPMIRDSAYLLSEDQIQMVYNRNSGKDFVIGRLLKEDIPVSLPWHKLFSSHIGIFGNTGSGKSNTLAKLYTLLFQERRSGIEGKSDFIIMDFNGEYTNNQVLPADSKSVVKLNTREAEDKFTLPTDVFWDVETLSILFNATTNTQRPFLNRMVSGKKRYESAPNSLSRYVSSTFQRAFTSEPARGDTLNLLRSVSRTLQSEALVATLDKVDFNGNNDSFDIVHNQTKKYFNTDGQTYDLVLKQIVDSLDLSDIKPFDELLLRANLLLINDLLYGAVQFDHIQPLLKRMESSVIGFRNILSIGSVEDAAPVLTVVSLRKCNQDAKKILPLLIAKHYYNYQRSRAESPLTNSLHLIIDEAHNILSQQSIREHEAWKDYRLELFEEIIKEGRKFGMFLTIASQRPADISPTIVSQIHNYFLHRLVNDRDLYLLENTISSLDAMSRSLIPHLSQGSCIATGTSFEIPMVIQVDKLPADKEPDSADIPLDVLWRNPE